MKGADCIEDIFSRTVNDVVSVEADVRRVAHRDHRRPRCAFLLA